MADSKPQQDISLASAAAGAESAEFRGLLNQTAAGLTSPGNPYEAGNIILMGYRRDLLYSESGESLPVGAQILLLEAQNKTNNSHTLARNITSATGEEKSKGQHTHHVVAQRALAADPARATLFQVGIGINDWRNGVNLPWESHKGLHTLVYYGKVNQAMASVAGQSADSVGKMLVAIGKAIIARTFVAKG